MSKLNVVLTAVLAVTAGLLLLLFVPGLSAVENPSAPQAWDLLKNGMKSKNADERATAVAVLGLLPHNQQAGELAEGALTDPKPAVRAAAATALGKMGDERSVAKLRQSLNDKDTGVVLAAAHSLKSLGDNSGYEVYYAVLTRERKGGAGLMDEQKQMLSDPKKMAQFTVEEGIGFVPFAGVGYGAFKALTKNDASAVRAGAAKALASDPDPRSGEALVEAVKDKSWLVRAAALEGLAQRGDAKFVPQITPAMSDPKAAVKYTAAAAVLRLSEGSQKAELRTGLSAQR